MIAIFSEMETNKFDLRWDREIVISVGTSDVMRAG